MHIHCDSWSLMDENIWRMINQENGSLLWDDNLFVDGVAIHVGLHGPRRLLHRKNGSLSYFVTVIGLLDELPFTWARVDDSPWGMIHREDGPPGCDTSPSS